MGIWLNMEMRISPTFLEKNINQSVRFLEKSSHIILKWFGYNQFQANATKCHIFLSTDQHVQVNVVAAHMENSSSK